MLKQYRSRRVSAACQKCHPSITRHNNTRHTSCTRNELNQLKPDLLGWKMSRSSRSSTQRYAEKVADQTYSDKVCKYFKLCNQNTQITAEEQSQTQQVNKEMLRLTSKFKASSSWSVTEAFSTNKY